MSYLNKKVINIQIKVLKKFINKRLISEQEFEVLKIYINKLKFEQLAQSCINNLKQYVVKVEEIKKINKKRKKVKKNKKINKKFKKQNTSCIKRLMKRKAERVLKFKTRFYEQKDIIALNQKILNDIKIPCEYANAYRSINANFKNKTVLKEFLKGEFIFYRGSGLPNIKVSELIEDNKKIRKQQKNIFSYSKLKKAMSKISDNEFEDWLDDYITEIYEEDKELATYFCREVLLYNFIQLGNDDLPMLEIYKKFEKYSYTYRYTEYEKICIRYLECFKNLR